MVGKLTTKWVDPLWDRLKTSSITYLAMSPLWLFGSPGISTTSGPVSRNSYKVWLSWGMVLENGPRALWERLGRIFTVCCTSVYISLDPSSKGQSHPAEFRRSWFMNWPMSETCVRDLEFPLWQLRLGFYSSDPEFFHLYMSSSILQNCPPISSPGSQGTHPLPKQVKTFW